MVISVTFTYMSIHFNLGYNVDLTLLSIAIVFPLVFNIRGAFRRREKALEHLSRFRSALRTMQFYVQMSSDLDEENKTRVEQALRRISDEAMICLKSGLSDTQKVDEAINQLHSTVLDIEENMSTRVKDRIFRFMNRLQEGFENVFAINTHRTPQSLKAYCLLFIYIFPLIYAPNIVYNIGASENEWIVYFIVVITEFILISLYNIQDQLEYPFDEYGMDDIKLDNFRPDR